MLLFRWKNILLIIKITRNRKEEFDSKNLILAASLAGFKVVADKGYDVEELSKYLDMVNINTYDYHGFWDKKTGHHSPITESGSRDMVI